MSLPEDSIYTIDTFTETGEYSVTVEFNGIEEKLVHGRRIFYNTLMNYYPMYFRDHNGDFFTPEFLGEDNILDDDELSLILNEFKKYLEIKKADFISLAPELNESKFSFIKSRIELVKEYNLQWMDYATDIQTMYDFLFDFYDDKYIIYEEPLRTQLRDLSYDIYTNIETLFEYLNFNRKKYDYIVNEFTEIIDTVTAINNGELYNTPVPTATNIIYERTDEGYMKFTFDSELSAGFVKVVLQNGIKVQYKLSDIFVEFNEDGETFTNKYSFTYENIIIESGYITINTIDEYFDKSDDVILWIE
jgi:hypothetical protein